MLLSERILFAFQRQPTYPGFTGRVQGRVSIAESDP